MVLAAPFSGSNLAMRSISESYRECVRNHACQEGRNFAHVQANKPNIDTQGRAEFYLKLETVLK